MRIISRFHDYYDCVQAMGQDQTVVYLRHEKGLNKAYGGTFGPYRDFRMQNGNYWNARPVLIGFCGTAYYLAVVEYADYTKHGKFGCNKPEHLTAYCYSVADVDEFVRAHTDDDHYKAYTSTKYCRDWPWGFRRQDAVKYFEENIENRRKSYENIFIENKVPIFVSDAKWRKYNEKNQTRLNHSLKEYEFFRIRDPYMAFQEISGYVGGILGMPNKPIPEISDEVMAEAKGFDKHSFRKAPGGKKRKQKT